MRRLAVSFLVLAFAICPTFPICAQQQGDNIQTDKLAVVVSTAEVRLDAVVKDKKGRPAKDLTAADFEIYEDGVRQDVQSFRQVGGDIDQGTAKRVINKEGSPITLGANYVALVFDRLSPGARALAHDAALKFVNEGLKPNDFVGVFGTALTLSIFQQYTNKTPLIKAGIERAGLQNGGEFTSPSAKVRHDRAAEKNVPLRVVIDPPRVARPLAVVLENIFLGMIAPQPRPNRRARVIRRTRLAHQRCNGDSVPAIEPHVVGEEKEQHRAAERGRGHRQRLDPIAQAKANAGDQHERESRTGRVARIIPPR